MAEITDRKLLEALAILSRACAGEGLPPTCAAEAATPPGLEPAAPETLPEPRCELLGEAALSVAFGTFAARGPEDGAFQSLLAALGLLQVVAGEEPDPPAEILAVQAEDERVEREVDRAGEALDAEFGRDADAPTVIHAMEARILGSAITLAGCTLPEGQEGAAAIRRHAARALLRLASGLLAMNGAESRASAPPTWHPRTPEGPPH